MGAVPGVTSGTATQRRAPTLGDVARKLMSGISTAGALHQAWRCILGIRRWVACDVQDETVQLQQTESEAVQVRGHRQEALHIAGRRVMSLVTHG